MSAADDWLAFVGKLGRAARALRAAGPVQVGATPREAVLAHGPVTLYRYRSAAASRPIAPLLIVYALVNRPYVVDLDAERSLVRALIERGLDVYLLDWGTPDASRRLDTLADYLELYLDRCVDAVRLRADGGGVNLLGICQGGTLALCYAALHPEKVRNLITTVTPVDFHTPDDLLARLVRHVDVDRLVDTFGNVPGELLNGVFLALKPLRLGAVKYLDLLERGADPRELDRFLRMERWIFDSPCQPAEVFRQFVKDFYQRNALVRGDLVIGARRVDPAMLTMPVLNVFARDDHLVPPASSKALQTLAGADYSALELPGGHIGIYVSTRVHRLLPAAVCEWLEGRLRK